MTIIRCVLLAITICLLAACGDEGVTTTTTANDPALLSRIATLKLTTSGTASASLAGIGVTVTLPDGVTPSLNADGSVAATVEAVSGVAAPGTVLAPVYTPASGTSKGTLRIVLAANSTAGFGAGEFATLELVVAAGANPVQSDFALSGLNPIDVNGNTATGLTAGVSNLAVQSKVAI